MGMLRTNFSNVAFDQPNERSLHSIPTPRVGGIAIFVVLIPLLFVASFPLLAVLAAILGTLSFLDDRHNLAVGLRFISHAIVAVTFAWLALPQLTWLPMLGAIFFLTWMMNLFNFMDGSDGLAGGMAVIGFGAYGAAAWLGQNESLSIAALCVCGCAAGFLYFNFPPAKVFMGDVGSIPLGFLAGAMGLYGWYKALWPMWFPALVFSPFIVDATITLLRRFLGGEKIWQAHRSHYYQRLIRAGWSHRKTALASYVLMILCGVSGLISVSSSFTRQDVVLPLFALLYMVLACLIDRAWSQHIKNNAENL